MRTNLMATQKFHEATGNMNRLCRKIIHININRRGFVEKVAVVRNFLSFIWDKILLCSIRINNRSIRRSPARYRKLSTRKKGNGNKKIKDDDDDGVIEFSCSSPSMEIVEEDYNCSAASSSSSYDDSDSDLVSLKISILGDCKIGKTSFVIKYVGDEQEKRSLQMKGLNLMDKTLDVKGARIAFKIWDVGGDRRSLDQVPIACKDAVAILFMFDLTSRCTLSSIIGWYSEAKKWNQSAIPILIGTKFDDFVQLPPDMQWTVITQARAYARAMKATLFFSSATHNINVNKIFKFIMAKLFNLPWNVKRNLTVGEPIIDF